MPCRRRLHDFSTSDVPGCAPRRRAVDGAGGGPESWGRPGDGARGVERFKWRNHAGTGCGPRSGRCGVHGSGRAAGNPSKIGAWARVLRCIYEVGRA
ncbi:hypothetical protein P171DRAFT_100240 [Karstenula rhodostoma CBS 690.94]|uniref:Uncharacterized protein n=1 Tax=Karstenula rhodostoma CBS 690.94 TaxID=1392251 RepID=A0A9P4P8H7_9PLEO|nr:hypothetical protein P171DRAFT_100240 [Karstenula rhodostoma CBS 690.94]